MKMHQITTFIYGLVNVLPELQVL